MGRPYIFLELHGERLCTSTVNVIPNFNSPCKLGFKIKSNNEFFHVKIYTLKLFRERFVCWGYQTDIGAKQIRLSSC